MTLVMENYNPPPPKSPFRRVFLCISLTLSVGGTMASECTIHGGAGIWSALGGRVGGVFFVDLIQHADNKKSCAPEQYV